MSERQKLRLAPLWWIGGWAVTLSIIYGSLEPPSGMSSLWPRDKVMHFSAYCVAAFWFSGMTERSRYPLVGFILLVLGGVIEFAQEAMGFGRTADWRDFAANTLGIATALAFAYAGFGSWMLRVERRLGLS